MMWLTVWIALKIGGREDLLIRLKEGLAEAILLLIPEGTGRASR